MRTADGRIAIIGGGFSGTALAIQLLARGGGPVVLIERSGVFGPGLAYGTRCGRHLLNVRSGRMSLFPDAPDHFTLWLAAQRLDPDPEGFARRADYGRYIAACLAEAQTRAPGRLSLHRGEVTEVRTEADGAVVAFADGRSMPAEHVVLANGNPPPARLRLSGLEELGERSVPDPWAPGVLEAVGRDEDVFLVGTGLTAVDVLLALDAGGWRGRAVAVSRRGLLPRTHGPKGEHGQGGIPDGPLSVRLRQVRRRARDASWTAVMDGLRPHGQAMWREASLNERRRFLRHLRPWWDVHRHRMAPEIGAAVDGLAAEGRLLVAAGRLLGAEAEADGLAVTWRPRGGGSAVRTRAGRLINCTGPEGDPSRAGQPVLEALLAQGAARTDPLRLGLDVDDEARVLDREGRRQARLWAMGTLTRGRLWEVVAVPEIREQAVDLAARLAPPALGSGNGPGRFTGHLHEVGETYLQHMAVALPFGARMLGAGAACMVHAVAPWLFVQTASRAVTRLHAEMAARRRTSD
ncbi:MAG: FAD/NAD(P)-binding protein [Proteobacteria bacterium]|nr:FAD/NAD(P)-binding protein [Pseudomonadota bacterium]